MLLNHDEITTLCKRGVVENWQANAMNAASLDIHLGKTIMVERPNYGLVNYSKREPLPMDTIIIGEDGYKLKPGEFILAHSVEVFNLPFNISAEYKLKSSMARIGLEHMTAGWCDAGWNGSALTLEFKNMTQNHDIIIRPGDPIGQMVFFKHSTVDASHSYSTKGRYNNDKAVSGLKQ